MGLALRQAMQAFRAEEIPVSPRDMTRSGVTACRSNYRGIRGLGRISAGPERTLYHSMVMVILNHDAMLATMRPGVWTPCTAGYKRPRSLSSIVS
jgi:hypothetical protein